MYRDESLARLSDTACLNASTSLLVTLLVIGTSYDAGTKSFTVLVVRSLSAILSTNESSLSAAVALVWVSSVLGSVLSFVAILRVSGSEGVLSVDSVLGSEGVLSVGSVLGSSSEGVLSVGSVLGPSSEGVLRVFGSGLRAGVTVAVAGVGHCNLRDVCIVHSASLSVLMSFIK